jgi:exodeoxyribonuclease-5
MKHRFLLKDRLPKKVKLIVVDEGSMVGEKLARDLMSFGIPMIILGDLNQLPPVMDKQFFLTKPDFILTKIMRQHEGNPIIHLSQMVLNNEYIDYGVYGNSVVIRKSDLTLYNFKKSDIVITVTNKLRTKINDLYRTEIKHIGNLERPHVGEKVICKKNDWDREIHGLFLTNGTSGYVSDVDKYSYDGISINMSMVPDFAPKSEFRDLEVDYVFLNKIDVSTLTEKAQRSYKYKENYLNKFDYGYAVTTWASQGSEYPRVLFMDENSFPDKSLKKKIEYTAITRASEQIIIVK